MVLELYKCYKCKEIRWEATTCHICSEVFCDDECVNQCPCRAHFDKPVKVLLKTTRQKYKDILEQLKEIEDKLQEYQRIQRKHGKDHIPHPFPYTKCAYESCDEYVHLEDEDIDDAYDIDGTIITFEQFLKDKSIEVYHWDCAGDAKAKRDKK